VRSSGLRSEEPLLSAWHPVVIGPGGHRRYAHVTALRCDAVNPLLLGMNNVVSEDALRRALAKIDEPAGMQWLHTHFDYCIRPLLDEPWVLDVDATMQPQPRLRAAKCMNAWPVPCRSAAVGDRAN
jgi:hypothetical protein